MAVEDINDIIEGRVHTFSVVAALVDHYYPGEVNTLWKEGRKWTSRSRDLRASIQRCGYRTFVHPDPPPTTQPVSDSIVSMAMGDHCVLQWIACTKGSRIYTPTCSDAQATDATHALRLL